VAETDDWPRFDGGWPDSVLKVRNSSYVVRNLFRDHDWRQHEVYFVNYLRDGVEDDFDHDFDHIPYEQDEFAWAAWSYLWDRSIKLVAAVVDGKPQPIQRDQVREVDPLQVIGPIWCPVANMVRERPYGPGRSEIKHGSKHFAPGAKLYPFGVIGWYPHIQVQVIGRHRRSHKYVTMIVRAAWLTNGRVNLVYSPHIISEVWPTWDGTQESKARAEEFVARLSQVAIEADNLTADEH
jgi:hypothetical protein